MLTIDPWKTKYGGQLTAVKALSRLCDLNGGWKAVGLTLGVNPQTVYQIVTRRKTESGTVRGVGRKLRERLEDNYPGWMQLAGDSSSTEQTITPAVAGQSQHVRPLISRMAPPKIGWEALMTREDLPQEFETELPDNAMAPDAPRGARCMFVTGVQPEPGDWVLLRDQAGALYCRAYVLSRPGQWEAHALNPAFLPLHADRDGLQVVAVFDGMRGRKAFK